jgi:predicted O-methyltransferase YrrM
MRLRRQPALQGAKTMLRRAAADAIGELERFMPTVDDALAVPREAGQFMHAMVLACGAKRGLEIGTSYGYSGLWIASALAENGGTLVTIDHETRKSEAARGHFETAGLADCVDLRTGRAADVIASMAGPFDFVLNDADKENCIRYVELLADKLVDRAIVLTDNTVDMADDLAAFVAWIRRREDFFSTGVPVGNGMELSVKRARPTNR